MEERERRPDNHWLIVRLTGTKSNRDGIGARVTVGNQVRTMTTAIGYASSSHAGLHFGLGTAADPGDGRSAMALRHQADGRERQDEPGGRDHEKNKRSTRYFGGVIARCPAVFRRSSAARCSSCDRRSRAAASSRLPRPAYARASCTCTLPSSIARQAALPEGCGRGEVPVLEVCAAERVSNRGV